MRPVSQPMGRCAEMWGDMGICLLFRRGSDKLPPSGASLSSRLTPSALSGDTLDLLILGGYYGEGRRRSGAVSTFLMGVRAPPEAAKRVGGAAHPLFYPFCKVGTGYSLPQLRELRERLMPASLTRRRGNALGHGASLTAVSCEQVSHEWKNSRRPAHLCHWEPSKVRVPPRPLCCLSPPRQEWLLIAPPYMPHAYAMYSDTSCTRDTDSHMDGWTRTWGCHMHIRYQCRGAIDGVRVGARAHGAALKRSSSKGPDLVEELLHPR